MEVAIVREDEEDWAESDDVYHLIRRDRKLTVCGLLISEIGDAEDYPGYRMCKRCERSKKPKEL